jgi:hypothetical protein
LPEPVTLEPACEQIETAGQAYLTAVQVAELLQVDEKTVLRWSLQTPRCRSCAGAASSASRASAC